MYGGGGSFHILSTVLISKRNKLMMVVGFYLWESTLRTAALIGSWCEKVMQKDTELLPGLFGRAETRAAKILICPCVLKPKVVCCFISKAERNHTGTLFPCIHNYWPPNSLHFSLNTSSFINSANCTVNQNSKENLQMPPRDKVNCVPAALEVCLCTQISLFLSTLRFQALHLIRTHCLLEWIIGVQASCPGSW